MAARLCGKSGVHEVVKRCGLIEPPRPSGSETFGGIPSTPE